MADLTQSKLKEMLRYDPYTGFFYRNKTVAQYKAGSRAGWADSSGYIKICINGKNYLAHRLAWLYMTGDWPKLQIDHINKIKADNFWENLREATSQQNQVNRAVLRNNTSGYTGVSFHRATGKWRAMSEENRTAKHLGLFSTPEEASAAYQQHIYKRHGNFLASGSYVID